MKYTYRLTTSDDMWETSREVGHLVLSKELSGSVYKLIEYIKEHAGAKYVGITLVPEKK